MSSVQAMRGEGGKRGEGGGEVGAGRGGEREEGRKGWEGRRVERGMEEWEEKEELRKNRGTEKVEHRGGGWKVGGAEGPTRARNSGQHGLESVFQTTPWLELPPGQWKTKARLPLQSAGRGWVSKKQAN